LASIDGKLPDLVSAQVPVIDAAAIADLDDLVSLLDARRLSPLSAYVFVQNTDPVDSISYIGRMRFDGAYCIMKLDETSGSVATYATIQNNPQITTYDDAWDARALTLIYGTPEEAFI
jgi:hypothetical protein